MPIPSTIKDLSTTAASNSPAGADTIGTSLDDYLRAIQAVLRAESLNKQWERWNDTPTRTGNTTFTVSGDLTSRYTAGRRVKCTDSTTIYGTIASSSYSAPNTTVTLTENTGNLSASLTEVELGVITPSDSALPRLFKVVQTTYDLSTASGTQTVTGAGFTPRGAIILSGVNASATFSVGFDDGTTARCWFNSTSSFQIGNNTASIQLTVGGGNQAGSFTSFNSDGGVITWTKTSSPTGTGTLTIAFLR